MRSLLWLALALPLAAAAQQVPGIDLSGPPAEKPPEPPPERTRVPTQELGTPPPEAERPKPAPARPSDALESAVGVPGERDTALEDRVKAVQRKGFLKRGRLQLTAFVNPTWNDAFYQKFGYGLRLAYNPHDAFAVAEWLRTRDAAGLLAPYFAPRLTRAERAAARVEGWILGVL